MLRTPVAVPARPASIEPVTEPAPGGTTAIGFPYADASRPNGTGGDGAAVTPAVDVSSTKDPLPNCNGGDGASAVSLALIVSGTNDRLPNFNRCAGAPAITPVLDVSGASGDPLPNFNGSGGILAVTPALAVSGANDPLPNPNASSGYPVVQQVHVNVAGWDEGAGR